MVLDLELYSGLELDGAYQSNHMTRTGRWWVQGEIPQRL